MKTSIKRIAAIGLLFFLAFLALLGSYGIIGDPTGKSMGIPLEYLNGTGFDDYLIPGIILLLTIGISSILIATTVIRKIKNYPFFIMAQGAILILWLTVELVMNMDFYTHYLHIPCYVIGISLVVLGLTIKERKSNLVFE